jgi:glyoxylase-like metal-dependent hydrolase (beta-lactamase superfamily II)
VGQLAVIGVKPSKRSMIGISHYHLDHIGQARDFPQAKLLIGQQDFEKSAQPAQEARAQQLAPWMAMV